MYFSSSRARFLKLTTHILTAPALLLSIASAGLAAPQKAPKTAPKKALKTAPMSKPAKPQRFLMAHYMPWYESKPFSGQWGWHWTMNHFNPDAPKTDAATPGQSQGASRFFPLIGLYDSGDSDALKCQVMQMKLAGIDGVIIDWYGNADLNDYALLNRNTQRLIPLLQQAGLRFAVCYEDQTVPKLIAAGKFTEAQAVEHGTRLMQWTEKNFFSNPAYLKLDGRPVLLSFGEPYYKDEQWKQIFSRLKTKPLYFTEHVIRAQTAAISAFDWPVPNGGAEGALREQNAFYERAAKWPYFIPAAYPRFQDIYAEANVHPSWGSIADREGRTYTETLTRALQSQAPIVQLVTWNDWGEGTQIEPSREFGYRDLEATQRLRTQYLDPKFSRTTRDLRLPVEWYRLKKKHALSPQISQKLDAVFPLVISGQTSKARSLLSKYP